MLDSESGGVLQEQEEEVEEFNYEEEIMLDFLDEVRNMTRC